MFGGDLFRAAWSAASEDAKKLCGAVAHKAAALGNDILEKARQGEEFALREIGKARDGVIHGGKVVGAYTFAGVDAGALNAVDLYNKAGNFTRRVLGFPAMPCPLQARQRLLDAMADSGKQNFELFQRALMAADVYNDPDKAQPIPGCHRLSDKELDAMGLDPSAFSPPDSEFRASLYQTDDGKYVLAFKGTTMTSFSDWLNNAEQGLGIQSDYYERAMQLALTVKQSVPPGSMEVVGHSLGGGLAQAAAAVAGVKGTTFNAAGLNPATVPNAPLATLAQNMTNYQVRGEILTGVQTSTALPKAVGTAVQLRAPANVTDPVSLHSMESVELSLAGY